MTNCEEMCQVCKKVRFRYSCPKCSLTYCSVTCYKSQQHLKCSEAFYKECIHEELTTTQANSTEDVRKIYEILQRIRESDAGIDPEYNDDLDNTIDSDDDLTDLPDVGEEEKEDDNEDIAARLQGIDINDADEVWQRLTTAERQDFQKLIACGDITKLLPDFKPWWRQNTRAHSKIVDLSATRSSDQTPNNVGVPNIVASILKFEDICKRSPSPCLHYNLWNLLAAYACTSRFFGGEQLTNPWEATVHLVNLSVTLKYNTNFEDAEDAIISVEMEALTTSGVAAASGVSSPEVEKREQLQQDAKQLMASRQYKLAALSDILHMCNLARQQAKRAKKKDAEFKKLFAMCSGNVELSSNRLQLLTKKIEFMLSYVMWEFGEEETRKNIIQIKS